MCVIWMCVSYLRCVCVRAYVCVLLDVCVCVCVWVCERCGRTNRSASLPGVFQSTLCQLCLRDPRGNPPLAEARREGGATDSITQRGHLDDQTWLESPLSDLMVEMRCHKNNNRLLWDCFVWSDPQLYFRILCSQEVCIIKDSRKSTIYLVLRVLWKSAALNMETKRA